MRESDASALAELSGALGYPVDAGEMALRLVALPASDDVLVAELAGEVVGWVHVSLCQSLVIEEHAQILGLVVAGRWRNRGIGRRLMAAAESTARRRGVSLIRLRSGAARGDAHAFCRAIGYSEAKQQTVFARRLSG